MAPEISAALNDVPSYGGAASVAVNGNRPFFTADELAADQSEPLYQLSALDSLGRCCTAMALIGPETSATEPRAGNGDIKPSGFQYDKYEWVDGKYLFNRCHLIGYQLYGKDPDARNLITGTRYFNTEGMLPYENRVADYVAGTQNHVLYRVTPVYAGDDLVADGVLMEAQSLEDEGAGCTFCVWCYNVQPGVSIDYATGANEADGSVEEKPEQEQLDPAEYDYILNTNSHRFHYPDCLSVADMNEKNKRGFNGTREEVIALGYIPCGRCNP